MRWQKLPALYRKATALVQWYRKATAPYFQYSKTKDSCQACGQLSQFENISEEPSEELFDY